MEKIEANELKKISGGAFHFGIAFAITAGITFIVGLVDGYIRPLACNR